MADLAEIYYPLVVKIAKRFKNTSLKKVELDDLIGYGSVGLVKAAQRYDPEKGCSFTTYAERRISGEIIDCFRQNELYFPRSAVDANRGLCPLPETYDVVGVDETYRLAENHDLWRKYTWVRSVESQILLLHFRNNIMFCDIAEIFGLSASYISILYGAAIKRLRDARFRRSYRTHPIVPVCCIKDCKDKYKAGGYCANHYRQWLVVKDIKKVGINRNRRGEHPTSILAALKGCKVADCTGQHFCKGFCPKHYQAFMREGRRRMGLPSTRQISLMRKRTRLNAELEPVLAVQELIADFDRIELPQVLEDQPSIEVGAVNGILTD